MPNWIDFKNFQFLISNFQSDELKEKLGVKDQKILLFAHRLSKRKGARYLPGILERLKDEGIVLIIIGSGPEREALKLQITNYKLQDKVRFLGWIPNEDLYKYYAITDVFIMPSEEEGFPHVLLEAMAAGAPFVAFDVGGVKEISPPGLRKFILPLGDVGGFADAVRRVLAMPESDLADIKNSEIQWVKRFDVSEVVTVFTRLFI